MQKTSIFILLVCLLFCFTGFTSAETERRHYLTQNTTTAPHIDGIMNEPAWSIVPWSGDFLQNSPDEGASPSQLTRFKIIYDSRNLYVGIQAFDSEPGKISERMSRRDGFDGDWVEINIDSLFDHRTAFSFTASVSGVKGDELISEDGENWDVSWDPIWFFSTNINEQGWICEMVIPFTQLRYNSAPDQTWGIQLTRRIYREEERSIWQFVSRDDPGWVSQFGQLRGLKDLKRQRQIELLPYLVAQTERYEHVEGNPFGSGHNDEFDFGLDGKVGITSNMTLNFTINPDFGQVEADPSEVNLTAFETFFGEKRPFFIEGRNIFNYPVTSAMWGGSYGNDQLFYSRRIGRPPQLYIDDDPDADYYADNPANTTILGAFKLTGKTKSGLSIGIMESVTGEENAEISHNGSHSDEIVEPLSNYFAARIQQDLSDGNTMIGAMFTATDRDIADDSISLADSAYTGGIDFFHRWFDNNFYVGSTFLFSSISGSEDVIEDLQQSSTHYFQRPDAEHLSLEQDATVLSGHGGTIRTGKSSGGRWRYELGTTWRAPGFDLNDIGFMRYSDRINTWTWIGYWINQPFSILNNFNVNFNEESEWDFDRQNMSNLVNFNTHMQFRSFWMLKGGVAYRQESLDKSKLRGGPAIKMPPEIEADFTIGSDYRKKFTISFGGNIEDSSHGLASEEHLWFDVRFKPTNALSITLNPFVTVRQSELEYIDTVSNTADEDVYIMGSIDQKTVGITLRLNFSITPELTIQYFGQPYISSGNYSDYKRVTSPRASLYSDRYSQFQENQISRDDTGFYSVDEDGNGMIDYEFDDPDFNVRYFISNLVLRWEYSPGSTLFLVWSQGRDGFGDVGEFSFRDDMKDLYSIHPHNVFLVKLSYWWDI